MQNGTHTMPQSLLTGVLLQVSTQCSDGFPASLVVLKNTSLWFALKAVHQVWSAAAGGCLLGCGLSLLGLLGQQVGVDVGQHTTTGNGHGAQQLAELLIVADGELDVAGDDAVLLVVTGSIACQLQHLSCQVLQHCCQVHGCTSTDALCVSALLQVASQTTHGELQTCLGAAGHSLALGLACCLATTRHDCCCLLL
ncbi:hypothetical protein COO60DRAFT_409161 [Scenedesmus sp. NREL 46B-D3]|nr:hypothetical protein COO60DRAFT_409161 [Scenedesmus sp. NREL 46B-D3]